jgi:hypothetical protein
VRNGIALDILFIVFTLSLSFSGEEGGFDLFQFFEARGPRFHARDEP